VHYESAENRENHGTECEFDHQDQLRQRLVTWQNLRLQKQQAQEGKDRD
jgi:hypothetical protein